MSNQHETQSIRVSELNREVGQLKETLRLVQEHNRRLASRRRRHLAIVGIGVSVIVHLCLMYYLASMYRFTPGGRGPQPVNYEFAILQDTELTDLDSNELQDLLPEVVSDHDDLPADESAAVLDPVVSAAELEVASAGSLPTLGGAGSGSTGEGSLSGGGAGTSFFGVSSRGMRFAYIVDRSGSMSGRKMQIAMQELARSVDSLPDYASFYVILFSSGFIEPPMQTGWMRARQITVSRFMRWLNDVDPSGGTEPVPAFHQIFSLTERPDVVFFLTDGEIPNAEETGRLIADFNSRGGRVIINTIAFGDPSSQELLKRIARESGGVYRFIPTEGR